MYYIIDHINEIWDFISLAASANQACSTTMKNTTPPPSSFEDISTQRKHHNVVDEFNFMKILGKGSFGKVCVFSLVF